MKHSHERQNDSSHGNPTHHHKSYGHKDRYRNHNTHFGFCGHSPFLYVAFQIFLIELCMNKPIIQPPGASAKAKCSQ